MSDNISDLQWNINRWYDANVGRWCSDAPIGFNGMDVNLERYNKNQSISIVDISGLIPENFKLNYTLSLPPYTGEYTSYYIGARRKLHSFSETWSFDIELEGECDVESQKATMPMPPVISNIIREKLSATDDWRKPATMITGHDTYDQTKSSWSIAKGNLQNVTLLGNKLNCVQVVVVLSGQAKEPLDYYNSNVRIQPGIWVGSVVGIGVSIAEPDVPQIPAGLKYAAHQINVYHVCCDCKKNVSSELYKNFSSGWH
jgi:RHS repeat-associated protein